MRRRGDVSSKSKAIAALEAVKAQEPIGSIARRYKVHPRDVQLQALTQLPWLCYSL